MIREYQSGMEIAYDGNGAAYPRWNSVVSIDLVWVSSAGPYFGGATRITLAGSAESIHIKEDYSAFITDWMEAKAR